jgi:hypothetical protein
VQVNEAVGYYDLRGSCHTPADRRRQECENKESQRFPGLGAVSLILLPISRKQNLAWSNQNSTLEFVRVTSS